MGDIDVLMLDHAGRGTASTRSGCAAHPRRRPVMVGDDAKLAAAEVAERAGADSRCRPASAS